MSSAWGGDKRGKSGKPVTGGKSWSMLVSVCATRKRLRPGSG